MVKILVIGGSRFIGKHILKQLSQKKHDVLVLNTGNVPHEKYLPENATHAVIDRNDEKSFANPIKDRFFDIVYDDRYCIYIQNNPI